MFVPTRPHRAASARRPVWLTSARASGLLDLERRFGVHLVVYVRDDTAEDHRPQLCQLYRKAHYDTDLALRLTALEHELPDGVAIVAYAKPWRRTPR